MKVWKEVRSEKGRWKNCQNEWERITSKVEVGGRLLAGKKREKAGGCQK